MKNKKIFLLIVIMSLVVVERYGFPDLRMNTKSSVKYGVVINNLYVKAKVTGYYYYGYNGYVKVEQESSRGVSVYGPLVAFIDHLYYWYKSYDSSNSLIDYEYGFTDGNNPALHVYENYDGYHGNIAKAYVKSKTRLGRYLGEVLIYSEWVETSVTLTR